MLFTYWHEPDHTRIQPFVDHWRAYFPDFEIVGDAYAETAVRQYFPEFLSKYRAIRIPACKSDLARLLAIYDRGGFYVDCHCAVKDVDGARRLLDGVTDDSVTLINRDVVDGKKLHRLWPLNSLIVARPGCPTIRWLAEGVVHNLTEHWFREKSRGFVPYDIWELTGPGLFRAVLLDNTLSPPPLRAYFAQRIAFVNLTRAPIRRHVFRAYHSRSQHWSVRQTRELLFEH